jgi:hypothetical protein
MVRQDAMEEPFVEGYFPHQMSWYAPEGPQGLIEAGSRWIRENPLHAAATAAAAGLLLAILLIPKACQRP